MANSTPRDRSGKPIRNYRPRKDFDLPGCPYGVRVPGKTYDEIEKLKHIGIYLKQITDKHLKSKIMSWDIIDENNDFKVCEFSYCFEHLFLENSFYYDNLNYSRDLEWKISNINMFFNKNNK